MNIFAKLIVSSKTFPKGSGLLYSVCLLNSSPSICKLLQSISPSRCMVTASLVAVPKLHLVLSSLLSSAFSSHASHSISERHFFPKMNVTVLSALEDNYMYLISDEVTKFAAVVDPVNPEKVLREVKNQGLFLQAILTTHHHKDHDGGNAKMIEELGSIDVYGGDERVTGVTKIVKHGDTIEIGKLTVKCLFTPCHTLGHICYYINNENVPSEPAAVFTGDTLFIAGCGRFFEGTPDMMYKALCETLYALPDDTKVFCGHEYTVTNLKFALTVEDSNEDIVKKLKWAEERRKAKQPTVPSTIGEEKKTNPFMRVKEPSVMKHAGQMTAIATMGVIRREKDNFRA